jgi:hypothetical protein
VKERQEKLNWRRSSSHRRNPFVATILRARASLMVGWLQPRGAAHGSSRGLGVLAKVDSTHGFCSDDNNNPVTMPFDSFLPLHGPSLHFCHFFQSFLKFFEVFSSFLKFFEVFSTFFNFFELFCPPFCQVFDTVLL